MNAATESVVIQHLVYVYGFLLAFSINFVPCDQPTNGQNTLHLWNSLPPALCSTSTSFTTLKKNLNHFCLDWHSVCDNVYRSLTMFSALAAVCTIDCAIEIVLITLHYICVLQAHSQTVFC